MKRHSTLPAVSKTHEVSRQRKPIACWGLSLSVVIGSLVWASPAAARPEYPAKIQGAFSIACTPTCLTCHTDPEGGADKLNKWGIGRGLIANAAIPDPVKTLTDLMTAPGPADFDGDGVNDDAELRAGTDPGAYGAISVCIPEYGCGAHVAKAPPKDVRAPFALLLAGLGLVGLLRRTRR